MGRELSDVDWQTIDLEHIETWKKAEQLYSSVRIFTNSYEAVVSFNFSDPIRSLEHRFNVMKRLVEDRDQSAALDFRNEEVSISCLITSTDSQVSELLNSASQYAEFLVYEAFILMNLSTPGCCDFDAAYMTRDIPNLNIYGKQITYDILLSNRTFEAALYEREAHPWLTLESVAIDKVMSWLLRVCPRFHMVPETPVAKCVYSLFYIASTDYSPASVSWVFYALESLFRCKPGENFNTLANRICVLLSLEPAFQTSLRRELRKLYDVRSSFIHGGMQIAHPMRNEALDERAEEAAWRAVPLTDFGVALILKSLQTLINLDALELSFEETMQIN